jgi:hypothetical protein
VAIWVRRGPNGQATLRVGITERNSAEDLNVATAANPDAEGKYCRRYRLCGCAAGTPCTLTDRDELVCWDPEVDDDPYVDEADFPEATVPYCGTSRCNENNTSTEMPDPLFSDRACTEAYTSDGLTALYCHNPGQDPNPPAKRERCGNPFSRPITVGLVWQLIRVPFSELRKADEAFVADELDLASVKQLVMTFTTGWIDFWVANVGFYRTP